MKYGLHLLLAAAVAALVGALGALVGPAGRGAEARGTSAAELAELTAALGELRTEQQALQRRLEALPAAPASAPTRAPAQDLDQAIAAYMARQLSGDGAAEAASDQPADLEIAAIADRILSGELTDEEEDALWHKLGEEKRLDALVAEIERQAALAPNNPDMATELGKAYLQKVFEVGMGPLAGVWGEKADKAFDRALELDETHWEARFNKALSLSNAPGFLGLQPEAIRQFEILVGHQERGASSDPDQAATYLFLGNLYDQTGESEKARATWRRGFERFPDSAALRGKTEAR